MRRARCSVVRNNGKIFHVKKRKKIVSPLKARCYRNLSFTLRFAVKAPRCLYRIMYGESQTDLFDVEYLGRMIAQPTQESL